MSRLRERHRDAFEAIKFRKLQKTQQIIYGPKYGPETIIKSIDAHAPFPVKAEVEQII